MVAVGARCGHFGDVREIGVRGSLKRVLVAVHSNNDLNSLIIWHLLRAKIITHLTLYFCSSHSRCSKMCLFICQDIDASAMTTSDSITLMNKAAKHCSHVLTSDLTEAI